MAKSVKFINGICQQLLFSPQGEIDGALVKIKGAIVQVSVHVDIGAKLACSAAPGKRLQMLAVADHSPKTEDGAHQVYRFTSFADAAGEPIEQREVDSGNVTIKGKVSSLHFARHGQVNGVILDSGEFIHLRPYGMTQIDLGIGSQVKAVGEARMTVLGTRMLEAHQVNGVELL